jgi:hypothetical protein
MTAFPYKVDVGIYLEIKSGMSREEVLHSTFKLSDVNIWLSNYTPDVDFIRTIVGDHVMYHFADANLAMIFKLTFGGAWVHRMNLPD